LNNPEDSKPEEESENEDKPFVDEETSYSFLFFATSGALLFVTLWSFWDDEYSRRGYKQYQNEYFKSQYARAEDNWKAVDKNIASKEQELKNTLAQVDRQLDDSDEYQILLDEVLEAEIKLGEVKELKNSLEANLMKLITFIKRPCTKVRTLTCKRQKFSRFKKK